MMPKAEPNKVIGEYGAYTAGLEKTGHDLGGNTLQPTHAATPRRVRNGKLATTSGPVAETKEQLGGHYLLETRGLNDAVPIAAQIPSSRCGSVAGRPIMAVGRP